MQNQQTRRPDNRGCFMPDISDDNPSPIAAFVVAVFCGVIVALIYLSNRLIPGLLW